jgi:hypothetical protein
VKQTVFTGKPGRFFPRDNRPVHGRANPGLQSPNATSDSYGLDATMVMVRSLQPTVRFWSTLWVPLAGNTRGPGTLAHAEGRTHKTCMHELAES